MIELFGIPVYDPDVVFTDIGLALLGGWLAWRMRAATWSPLRAPGIVILAGLATAALAGAIFHGLFPGGRATPAGYSAWLPVPLSINLVATTLLDLSLEVLAPRLPASLRRGIAVLYALAFAGVILLRDESFGMIVRFYAPVLGLFLVASVAQAVRLRSRAWTLIAISFAISALAAFVQQARLGIHPEYFDHNAVYHVMQGIAMVVLYRGIRG